MARLRVSAISFLNTAPLMWDFEQPPEKARLARHFEVSYMLPSECADALAAGDADIGIVPVAAYASIPGLRVVPGVAIAAKGAVRSILLLSKVPLERIRRLAADTASRTSIALCRVLLKVFHVEQLDIRQHRPLLKEMLAENDAALIIGDAALCADISGLYVYDLANLWKIQTGLPFVFAFWAVREKPLAAADMGAVEIVKAFQESRDHGRENIHEIARVWAPPLRLKEESVREYLRDNVDYTLDEANLAGLRLFYQYAGEMGILPKVEEIAWL